MDEGNGRRIVINMARSQTWTRNISKKLKPPSRSIVDPSGLEKVKRVAEDLRLILHKQDLKKRVKKTGSK